jgi:hypothetical protein
MANLIKIKDKTTTGGSPSLTDGEIAINRVDANLWYNNEAGTATKSFLPTETQALPVVAGGTGMGGGYVIGDMLYADSSTSFHNLPAGTDGQVLTSTGSGSPLAWEAIPTDTNTWRPVTAGGQTLTTSETLAFTAGTGIL